MSIEPIRPEGLPQEIVSRLQDAVTSAAKHGLTARRFLDFEGPLGAGVTSIEVGRVIEHEFWNDPVPTRIVAQRTVTVPMLFARFRIPIREILGARDQHLPLSTRPADDAGQSIALAEERLVYYGDERLGLVGLANAPEAQRVGMGDWNNVGQAIQDVIQAADQLDAVNARQPFSLVLAPHLYNRLFRKYEGSDVLQIRHLEQLASGGVIKSLALREGGLLVSTDVGPLVCAQDMETKFLLPSDAAVVFEVSEAIVLRLDDARAVCRIGNVEGK
jgi:uncharacterized linocin/CFP29 family protein